MTHPPENVPAINLAWLPIQGKFRVLELEPSSIETQRVASRLHGKRATEGLGG